MAKTGGLGDHFLVGGYDVSGDIQALDKISGGPALWDTTDITLSAHSRAPVLRDGQMSFTAYFDPANAHPVLSALPTTDVLMTYLRAGILGNAAACLNAKQVGYDPTRAADGGLLLKSEGQGNGFGLEWGIQLVPGVTTDSGGTSHTAIDNGASSAFGAQAYLQVTAFTGTDATVTIKHSTDNTTFTNLIAFTQVTAAPFTQRAVVSNVTTIDRYVRVLTSTTGGFTVLTFAVVFCRNPVAGVVF